LKRALFALGFASLPLSAAHADPIFTPIFVSVLGAAGIGATTTIAGVTINIAAVLSAVVTTAIGIGLVLLFSPKPKPEVGAIPVQQPLPYRAFAYGTVRMAGSIMLKENVSNTLNYVAALISHRITKFTGLYMNDDAVNIGVTANMLFGTVQKGYDARYTSAITIDSRLGMVPETAYATIVTSTNWGPTYRGDGIASLAMSCQQPSSSANFSKYYPYSGPAPSVVFDSAMLFNPGDMAQAWNDPTTWKFSRNAALAILHHQCFNEFGPKRDYQTAIVPVLDLWGQAIADCFDVVARRAGGNELRYAVGGWATSEQDRKTVLQALLNACDGHLVERGDGALILRVGKYHAPTVTLTDADIVGFTIQSALASEDVINQATAKYSSPDNGFVTVETDPVIDTSDQAARLGGAHAAQFDLSWVQSPGQASRLLAREMLRQKEPVRGKLYCRLSALNACYERYVNVQSNTIPFLSNKDIEIRRSVIDLQSAMVEVDFIGTGAYMDTYDPATQETSPPIVPIRPMALGEPTPGRIRATPSIDGSGAVRLDFSWDSPIAAGYGALDWTIQWRIADTGSGYPGSWAQHTVSSAGTINGRIVGTSPSTVPSPSLIEAQVFTVPSGNQLATTSAIIELDTTPANCSPGQPTGVAATTPGAGAIALSATAPVSVQMGFIRFYAGRQGDPFDLAVPISGNIACASGATITASATIGGGHYDIWATAVNPAGISSVGAGPVHVFVADPALVAPTGLSAPGSSDGSGNSPLSVTAPGNADFFAIQFYVAGSGAGFGAAVPVGPQIAATPGATVTYSDIETLGSWDYYATAISKSYLESAPAGAVTAVLA